MGLGGTKQFSFQTSAELLRKQILPFGSEVNSSSVSVGRVTRCQEIYGCRVLLKLSESFIFQEDMQLFYFPSHQSSVWDAAPSASLLGLCLKTLYVDGSVWSCCLSSPFSQRPQLAPGACTCAASVECEQRLPSLGWSIPASAHLQVAHSCGKHRGWGDWM